MAQLLSTVETSHIDTDTRRVPLQPLGWALAAFLMFSYTLCILLGLVVPNFGLHQPWLQFYPGFEWLSWKGYLIGLAENFVYGWYTALVFGWLYNYFVTRLAHSRA